MDGDLFSFGEEEEKALKAQENKQILEEQVFSLSDGDDPKGFGEFSLDDVDEDLW